MAGQPVDLVRAALKAPDISVAEAKLDPAMLRVKGERAFEKWNGAFLAFVGQHFAVSQPRGVVECKLEKLNPAAADPRFLRPASRGSGAGIVRRRAADIEQRRPARAVSRTPSVGLGRQADGPHRSPDTPPWLVTRSTNRSRPCDNDHRRSQPHTQLHLVCQSRLFFPHLGSDTAAGPLHDGDQRPPTAAAAFAPTLPQWRSGAAICSSATACG